MAPRTHRAWILAIGFAMNAMLGTAYAWSVFKGPLMESFGASNFAAQLPFAVALAMFSVGMVVAGRLVDRHGPRKVAILGGLLVGGGYLLSSLMDDTPWPMATLTLTYGGVVGLGIGFAYSPPIPTAIRWFPDRKGLASGVVVMGFGLSALFTAPLADAFIAAIGVADTFLVLGVVFLVLLVALGSRLRLPPEDWKGPPTGARSRRRWTPLADVPTQAAIRSPAFWSAWILYVLGTAVGFMVIGNAKTIAIEVALLGGLAATGAVQLLAVFNSAGRPLFGRWADVAGPKRALLAMYLVLLAGMALMALAGGLSIPAAALLPGIALTGIVFGGFLAVMPALATYYFGTKHLGTNYGVLFTGYGFGAIVALFTSGWIRDVTGSYAPAFYVGILLSVAGLLLGLQVRPPRPTVAKAAA